MLTSATQVRKRPLKFHFRASNVGSAEAAQLLPPSNRKTLQCHRIKKVRRKDCTYLTSGARACRVL